VDQKHVGRIGGDLVEVVEGDALVVLLTGTAIREVRRETCSSER
jgi:hypothetical protein